MKLKYIPNVITILRLLLIVPFAYYLFHHAYVIAFYIYIFAGLTDGLDGLLARLFNWQTELGGFLDPLSDKLLITTSFVSLGLIGQLPWWLVILVFLRDFTISSGVLAWYLLIGKHIHFEPSNLSKANTMLQIALVTLCLFELAYVQLPDMISNGLIILTTLTTTISFVDYVLTWGKRAYLFKQ
jgi:cardiolipin synthase (CMP-forming)